MTTEQSSEPMTEAEVKALAAYMLGDSMPITRLIIGALTPQPAPVSTAPGSGATGGLSRPKLLMN